MKTVKTCLFCFVFFVVGLSSKAQLEHSLFIAPGMFVTTSSNDLKTVSPGFRLQLGWQMDITELLYCGAKVGYLGTDGGYFVVNNLPVKTSAIVPIHLNFGLKPVAKEKLIVRTGLSMGISLVSFEAIVPASVPNNGVTFSMEPDASVDMHLKDKLWFRAGLSYFMQFRNKEKEPTITQTGPNTFTVRTDTNNKQPIGYAFGLLSINAGIVLNL